MSLVVAEAADCEEDEALAAAAAVRARFGAIVRERRSVGDNEGTLRRLWAMLQEASPCAFANCLFINVV